MNKCTIDFMIFILIVSAYWNVMGSKFIGKTLLINLYRVYNLSS